MADTLKNLKIIIIILSVLLGLSLATLVGITVYSEQYIPNASAVSPDNYIEPAKSSDSNQLTNNLVQLRTIPTMLCAWAPSVDFLDSLSVIATSKTIVASGRAKYTVVSIYKSNPEDSEPFSCLNMFPGDSDTNLYKVQVSHRGTVTVRFHADIHQGYEKLAEVLRCRVVLHGENKTLYDGLMRDMPQSVNYAVTSASGTTTELVYEITVYLDTSVGNEYMNQELVANFRWWVMENGPSPIPPITTVVTTESEEPDVTVEPDAPVEGGDVETDEAVYPENFEVLDYGELIEPTSAMNNTYLFIVPLIALAIVLIGVIVWRSHRKNGCEKEKTADE